MSKQYEQYKNSGIEWLGKIPAHWKSIKLKFFFDSVIGGAWGSDPVGNYNDLICVRVADFDYDRRTLKNKDFTRRNFTESEQSSRLLQKGDLILEKSGGGEKTPVGRVVQFNLDEPAVCSNFTNKLSPKSNYNSKYLTYLFYTLYNSGVTQGHVKQTTGIQNLDVSGFLDEFVFIPESEFEQVSIADYLNYKTTQIDKLIAQKEQLMGLLQRKRQAIINEAVTQGLNPNAPLTDSGIEWLGEIPAHWKIMKLKRLSECITDGAHISPDTSSDDYPFVSTVDIKQGKINFEKCLKTTTENYEYLVKTGCKPKVGDVLFSKDGTIGRTAIIDFEKDFVVASSLIIITPNQKLIAPDFLELVLQSLVATNYVESVISGSALRRISIYKVTNIPVTVPPYEEQQQIWENVNLKLKRIEKCVDKIVGQLKKFKSYRQSIISEVVTGKVDVREVALNEV